MSEKSQKPTNKDQKKEKKLHLLGMALKANITRRKKVRDNKSDSK